MAKDGQKLTLGDTTITMYSTPTSTPGNLSLIFPLKDGNQRHIGGMWGGDFMRIVQEGIQDVARHADHETKAISRRPNASRISRIKPAST